MKTLLPQFVGVVPSSAGDAVGLLNAAFASGRPTVFLYPKSSLNLSDRRTSDDCATQFVHPGRSRTLLAGDDLTLFAHELLERGVVFSFSQPLHHHLTCDLSGDAAGPLGRRLDLDCSAKRHIPAHLARIRQGYLPVRRSHLFYYCLNEIYVDISGVGVDLDRHFLFARENLFLIGGRQRGLNRLKDDLSGQVALGG